MNLEGMFFPLLLIIIRKFIFVFVVVNVLFNCDNIFQFARNIYTVNIEVYNLLFIASNLERL